VGVGGSPTALWRKPVASQDLNDSVTSFASGLLRLCLYPASRFQNHRQHGLRMIRVVSRLFEIPPVHTRSRGVARAMMTSRSRPPRVPTSSSNRAEKGDSVVWAGLTPLKMMPYAVSAPNLHSE